MFIRSVFTAMLVSAAFTGPAAMASTYAEEVSDTLIAIKGAFASTYAPAEWKKKHFGYDLEKEFDKAEAAIKSRPNLSQSDAYQILRDFVYATRDYHTGIYFHSTASATLPFMLEGVGDRFFIVYIDRDKLPETSFPFQVGDELTSFDGRPTIDVVRELQAQIIANTDGTDRAQAARMVTRRVGYRGFAVPNGPVTISVRPQGQQKEFDLQLIWDSTPELITPRTNFALADEGQKWGLFNPLMMAPHLETEAADANPFQIGARRAFTPDLGMKVWESDETNEFYAYIYKTPDRKLVGYLRLPSYVPRDATKAVADFAKIITRFETAADSMIIDQVNNPGGSVYYLYALASMLSDKPLIAPRHRMTITQADVAEALNDIEQLKNVKTDADVQKAFPNGLGGYPASYELVRFQLAASQFVVSEWNAGRRLTQPYWLGGVDHINPAKVRFTKPILILINHLDFSGGDFFPTIMQDNKRATIMGSRTAGAGGYILSVTPLNAIGIDQFSVTGSIAERVDGNPIENLGVTPDIPYEMTVEDYTKNYVPYVQAIQNAINSLTP